MTRPCPIFSLCRRPAADAAIRPLLNLVAGSNAASYGGSIMRTYYSTSQHASYLAWRESLTGSTAAIVYDTFAPQGAARDVNVALASRLVPRSACESDAERAAAVEAFAALLATDNVDGLLVVGGRVSTADAGSAQARITLSHHTTLAPHAAAAVEVAPLIPLFSLPVAQKDACRSHFY